MYYRNANAAIVVYDITNPYSFEKAQKWYYKFWFRVSELKEKAPQNIILAICGNKIDLEERKVSLEVTMQ